MKSFLLAGAMVLGVAARAFIHFGTDLEPRINGPYYLVQVRSIMESAHLAVPDLPLIFWLQAAVAKLIQFFVSAEPERAVLLACKAVDCVAPVLLVIPVHWLLGQWRSASAGVLTIAAALALAVVHPPLLSMTSEFEKNALGLVWFAAFAVSMRQALMEPSRVAAAGVLCFSALAGFTHVGVFGATLLFAALAFAAGIALLPDRRRWLIRLGLVSLCVSSLVLVIVAHYFDSRRGEQLAHSILPRVQTAVSAAPSPSGAVSHAVQPARQMTPHGASLAAALVFTVIVPVVLIHAAAIGALLVLWRRRRELPPGERVFVAATAVTALVLAWPFVVSDLAVRLQMIGVVPLVLLIPFVFSHWRSRRGVQIAATAVLAITVGSLWFTLGWNTEPTIPEDSLAELKSLQTSIAAPAETLIIARHGLEWWAVWALRTKISHASAVREGDWQRYQRVLVLTQKRGGPGALRPPAAAGHKASTPANEASRRDGTQRSFDEFEIPTDAEILADGRTFTLTRLSHPPPNVPR